MQKIIKRYIPKNVFDFLSSSEYNNKEHLYIICDMIYRISIFRKEDTDYSNKFVDIPRNYFTDIITNKVSYKTAINFLIENNVVVSDNIYSKESGKAKGYKFNDNYISKLIPVEIIKPTLTKKIINNKNSRNNSVNEKYKRCKEFFLNSFSLDYGRSIEYLNEWFNTNSISLPIHSSLCGTKCENYIKLINQYNTTFISLSAIKDGELYFRKNPTNGRIDTNLTSLKSEYKKFLLVKDVFQIDITNSQPYILSLLLNSSLCGTKCEKQELEKYTQWTSKGLFYENFQREYYKFTDKMIERKEIKDIMFCIFYSKNKSYLKEKRIFRMLFPSIMSWIEDYKSKKHNLLAIDMQKMESEMCIDIISQEIDRSNINYYTIHDAWLVNREDVLRVETIIKKCFKDKYNSIPKLKIEKIS